MTSYHAGPRGIHTGEFLDHAQGLDATSARSWRWLAALNGRRHRVPCEGPRHRVACDTGPRRPVQCDIGPRHRGRRDTGPRHPLPREGRPRRAASRQRGTRYKSPGSTHYVRLSREERGLKRQMLNCFVTQRDVLEPFGVDWELFRPAPAYRFDLPPHRGRLWYERFDWGIDGARWRRCAREALRTLHLEESCRR
jgi:hypothetical protein